MLSNSTLLRVMKKWTVGVVVVVVDVVVLVVVVFVAVVVVVLVTSEVHRFLFATKLFRKTTRTINNTNKEQQ